LNKRKARPLKGVQNVKVARLQLTAKSAAIAKIRKKMGVLENLKKVVLRKHA